AAAASKNIVTLLIARRNEVAHIFDQAKDGHVYFLEHGCRLARIDERDLLRRGHDNRAYQRNSLDNGELNITGARWQIEHKHVEFASFNLTQQLLRVTRHHRSMQNSWRDVVDQNSH